MLGSWARGSPGGVLRTPGSRGLVWKGGSAPRGGKCHHVVAELPSVRPNEFGFVASSRRPVDLAEGGNSAGPPCTRDCSVCLIYSLLESVVVSVFFKRNLSKTLCLWIVTTVNICLEGGD